MECGILEKVIPRKALQDDDDEDDDFEPLFNYRRQCSLPTKLGIPGSRGKSEENQSKDPGSAAHGAQSSMMKPGTYEDLEDDDDDDLQLLSCKKGRGGRTKNIYTASVKKRPSARTETVTISLDEEEDDCEPPPPPPMQERAVEDPLLASARRQREELRTIKGADDVERAVESKLRPELDERLRQEEAAVLKARQEAALLRRKEADARRRLESAASEAADAEEEEGPGKIVIHFRTPDEQKKAFSLRKDDPLEKAFNAFKKKLSPEQAAKCTFRFDGERLNPSETPLSLDMDDEDIIDVTY